MLFVPTLNSELQKNILVYVLAIAISFFFFKSV